MCFIQSYGFVCCCSSRDGAEIETILNSKFYVSPSWLVMTKTQINVEKIQSHFFHFILMHCSFSLPFPVLRPFPLFFLIM